MESVYQQLLSRFAAPAAAFRPQMFWVWNGTLDHHRIEAQVADLAEKGCGGFFIHPMGEGFRLPDFIRGIEPPYLSEGYFDAVRCAVEAARRHGIYAWLYDEGGWPSGTAQGRVLDGHPEFTARVLARQETDATAGDFIDLPAGCVAALALSEDGAITVLEASEGRVDVPHWARRLLLVVTVLVPGRPDLMDPAAVRRFIDLTHERYAQHIGEHFGTTVPGMFTDEPGVPGRIGSGQVQWTDRLAEAFRQRTGRDLLPLLPALFPADAVGEAWHAALGQDLVDQTRCAFAETWTDLYREAYWQQKSQWCEEHGIVHTGHVGGEDTLREHALHGFGHFFKTVGALHVPGVDAIWRQLHWEADNFDYPRFAASVAHQKAPGIASQPFDGAAITETNGVYGHGLTYEHMRWLVDYQASCGIDLFAPMCYSLHSSGGRLFRTQDDIGPSSPLWPLYGEFADYVGRLCALLRAGSPLADVAVYYPIEAVWTSPEGAAAERASASLVGLTRLLNEEQTAFDFIDAETLAAANASGGAVETPGEDYSTVIVPESHVLPLAVAEKLLELQRSGGRVVFLTDIPSHCSDMGKDAEYAAALAELTAAAFQMDAEAEARLLDDNERLDGATAAMMGPRDTDHFASHVSRRDVVLVVPEEEVGRLARLLALTCGRYAIQPQEIEPRLRLLCRQVDDIQIAFAMNDSLERLDVPIGVVHDVPSVLERWFPADGARRAILWHREVSEISATTLSLAPGESALLVLVPIPDQPTAEPVHRPTARELVLTAPVVIGYCTEPQDVRVVAEHEVRDGGPIIRANPGIELPARFGSWESLGIPDFSGIIAYHFTIAVAEQYLDEDVFLDLGEVGHSAIVTINGEELPALLWHPYTVEVSEYLREDDNDIVVTVHNTFANQVASERVVDEATRNGWLNSYYTRALPMMRETLESGLIGPVRLLVRP